MNNECDRAPIELPFALKPSFFLKTRFLASTQKRNAATIKRVDSKSRAIELP